MLWHFADCIKCNDLTTGLHTKLVRKPGDTAAFFQDYRVLFCVVRSRNKTNTHLNAGSHLIAVNEFPRSSSNSHKASRLISPCRQIFTCCEPNSPSFIFTRSLLGIIRVFYPYISSSYKRTPTQSCEQILFKFSPRASQVSRQNEHGATRPCTWSLDVQPISSDSVVPFLGLWAIKAFYFTSIAKINQENYSKEKYLLFLSSFKTEHISFLKDPRTDYSMALRE